jgi:general secretion pathway protein A
MDYFRILNFKKEPFSNSPEPEFFFQVPRHVECLQKLELGIRLHRGLHVVIGPVGTGKTTLCREVIVRLHQGDGTEPVETHLILDPSFSTSVEFLSTVAGMLMPAAPSEHRSEWQLKEDIKNYLFEENVRKNKTVVLMIDEGQKLPDFCIEILREFLNYETNDRKMLQIVIFAQNELSNLLKERVNFADRINLLFTLGPLNFRETREMILYRIRKASSFEEAAPSLFTPAGFLAVYHVTGGYPRKIINLCHQVVLAMIIQNRTRAGWRLSYSCARRVEPIQGKNLQWTAVGATTAAVAACLIFLNPGWFGSVLGTGQAVSPPPLSASLSIHKTQLPENIPVQKSTKTQAAPEILGKLTIPQGKTVWWRLNDIYGPVGKGLLDEIRRANPQIRNINRISAGEAVQLPALPTSSSPLSPGRFRVQITRGSNLDEVYGSFVKSRALLPALWFVPYWNTGEGMVFAVFMKEEFGNRESAMLAAEKLPTALSPGARIVAPDYWKPDFVFFTSGNRSQESGDMNQ